MTKKFQPYTATEGIEAIKSGQTSAAEIVEQCCQQIDRVESGVHAWVYFDKSKALAQAKAIDARRADGIDTGPLYGIPVGIKDIINVIDMPCGMGSPIWDGFKPGNDARVVSKIRLAGATIAGKTVTAEFAVHTPGKTLNPHDPEFSPGTSSSGSAAAVATGMVPLAIGTQTAGSITRPASYCGVYGCKPSFGLVPRTGMLKTTDSLDQVGYFARSVEDVALMFDIVRVKGTDFPIHEAALGDVQRQQAPQGRPWKIGVVSDSLWVWGEAYDYAKAALQEFASSLSKAGAIVEPLKLPAEFNQAHSIHETIYDKTLAYYFKEEHQKHQLISEILNAMILKGQKISLDDYKQALDRQAVLAEQLDQLLAGYDMVITLTTAGSAPKFAAPDLPDSSLIWSLCGVPVVSVPAFKSRTGMPFGLQVLSRRYNDIKLLTFLKYLKAEGLIRDAEIPARG
jgi:Asp-tRNA(Asn)/Glu-tRNA(Gln) amidotransferase A subunit family amidase